MRHLIVMRSRSAAFWLVLACCILFSLIGLAACGNNTTTHASSSQQTTKSSTSVNTPSATTTTQGNNHVSLAELVGQPAAKLTQGANFQVTGQVRNMEMRAARLGALPGGWRIMCRADRPSPSPFRA
jgi:hypothetical protein